MARLTAVPPAPTSIAKGFTLIELAIVLFIIALLLGGMLLPLAGQQDIRSFGDTQKILAEARDALLGFAAVHERLPCPASATSNGLESFCDSASGPCVVTLPLQVQPHGRCSNPYDGFFPAAALGFTPIDAQGYALDGWGGETLHRIRYAVSTNSPFSNDNYPPYQSDFSSTGAAFAFTYLSGMKAVSMTSLLPDLRICSRGTGMQSAGLRLADCPVPIGPDFVPTVLTTDAVAVIYSPGKNAGTGGTGADENHNPNPQSTIAADRAFVNAQQATTFDDQLLWLSKSALFNRMVAAGRLP
ncbi:MAG: prepilin-type N-terminal cleavage/methylation domain-containing protein [Sulfuritalea sp.]|nr:prepilin-type N-terminal cleavage/methylation domain-containing protein [Sulfuritalea sp.]